MIDVSCVKLGPAVSATPSSQSVNGFFLKNKNNEPLYVGYKHIQPGKFSRNHILLDYPGWWHINLAKYFQIGWLRYFRQEVKLSIFSANREYPLRLLLYQNIVISWWFLLDKVGRSDEISRAGLASQSDPGRSINNSLSLQIQIFLDRKFEIVKKYSSHPIKIITSSYSLIPPDSIGVFRIKIHEKLTKLWMVS